MEFNIENARLNTRINDLLSDILAAVQSAPRPYLIGDGESWQRKVGHDFDKSRLSSAKRELRDAIVLEIGIWQSKIKDQEKLHLLKELEVAIWHSDDVLLQIAYLFKTKEVFRAFKEIRLILKEMN